MRFIHVWSYKCADFLTKQLNENHQKRSIYYYGFQILIGAMVKGVLLVAISMLLGSLIPTLTAVLVFAALRVMAGGYHMDTYGKCIGVSLALFIIAGTTVQYTYKLWPVTAILVLSVISFITGIYVIYKWAPRDNPNRLITKPEEIKKFRRQSMIYMLVWGATAAVLISMKLYMFTIAVCFGLLLELFTITPIGYKFFDRIRGKISFE